MDRPHGDVVSRAARSTVAGLFNAQARTRPERIAVVDGERTLSYGQLDDRAHRLAGVLAARGVRHGDRVALLSENRLEVLELFLAAARLGAIVACQNWRLAAPELAHCLALVTPTATVVSAVHAGSLGDVTAPIVLGDAYERLLAAAPPEPPSAEVDPEDPLLILYTSGTTGLPKGAVLSHRAEIVRNLVMRSDDRDVPDGTPGELAMRGPTLFSGYWNQPEVNAHDFRGGWFHMGDVFVRNADGTLDFVDRVKYLIKSGGESIYPAEIERVMLQDPRVAEVAVVRARDARWGEVPVAFVARRDPSLDETALAALCRAQLAGYKQPKGIYFIPLEAFPRSASGKVQRHELEARIPDPAGRKPPPPRG